MKLSDVAHALRAELNGEGHLSVTRLVHPADATGPADLAVALTPDAIDALPSTKAGAVVARVGTAVPAGAALLTYAGHERMALAILTQMFDPGPAHDAGIDPQAAIAADAKIAESASIGPFSAIGARSTIGAGTVILSGATVGADVVIGSDCLIHPGVRIADRVLIGDRVTIQANAVIGADGFSFIPVRNPDGTRNPIPMPARIHSLGTVVIADDVEIGAGTTIDRATLRETRIGKGTKIDNQVQIAHNVVIGESALICGMAGIAGSVVIGNRALLAAGAGVADHLTIGEDATLAASSGTASSLPPGEIYSGTPAVAHKLNMERYVNVARLKQLYPQVDDLKKRLLALEKGNKGG